MKEIKQLLSKIAPTLAAAIGTPIGAIAATILTSALELPPTATEEQVKSLVQNPDAFTFSKIKQADAMLALHLEQIKQEAQKELSRNENIREEVRSQDTFTSRARPSFLYLFYFILIMIIIIMPILGIFLPHEMGKFYVNVKIAFSAIPSELWGVFCAGYLGYSGVRTYEKTKGVAK